MSTRLACHARTIPCTDPETVPASLSSLVSRRPRADAVSAEGFWRRRASFEYVLLSCSSEIHTEPITSLHSLRKRTRESISQ